MWELKVFDIIDNRNPLAIVADFDGTLVNPKYDNLAVAIMHHLDRSGKFGGRYQGLLRETLNDLEKAHVGYRDRIKDVTQNLYDFAVTTLDWHRATNDVVEKTELDKSTKDFLKTLQKVSAECEIRTGCEESAAKVYFRDKIANHIPNVKVEVKGTKVETDGGGYFTGNVIEPIWDAQKRAEEAEAFTFGRMSLGVGNSKPIDGPFLRFPTVSYLLRGPVTAYEIGRVDENIKYIDRRDLNSEFKEFLNTDARKIPLPMTNLNFPFVRSA